MPDVSHDDHLRQTWTLHAFLRARRRLRELTDVDSQSYAATAEALYWACAADEGFDELLRPDYKERRDSDSSGKLLNGVRWARNRMTHQRAIVVQRHYGTDLDVWVLDKGALDTRTHLVWLASSDIPPGRHDRGRDVYDRRLAGKPVEEAVESCGQWLFGPTLNELSTRAGLAIGDLPRLSDPM